MKNVTLLFALLLSFGLFAQPKIQLDVFATGFTKPVDIAHAGDNRLFIVEQDGAIRILDSNGVKLTTPFLNINPRVRSTGNEQGLLGLAFHPEYAQNGYFYVYYTRETDGDTRVSRFSRDTLDPNKADPDSELILLVQDQPYSNHNGGCIRFGPDGYLYIGLGDGGSGGDPQGYGQNTNTFLGKMLRIDVDNPAPGLNYSIPADNPFVNDPAYKPEIWSLGLRNPWRFAFDRLTGDIWIGDVGQNTREEVDFEPAGMGGRNYGWRCYEGNVTHNTSGCEPASEYVFPVFDYDNNSLGCSITGGMIYRGTKYSDLYGQYLFSDYCSGRWWATKQNDDGTFTTQLLANLTDYQYTAYGEDIHGELYVAEHSSGRIMSIREICSDFQVAVDTVWNVACDSTFSGLIALEVTGGAAPVNTTWSIDQQGELVVYLLAGTYTYTAVDNNGCERTGSAEVLFTGVAAPEVTLVSGNAALCPGETASLGVPPAPANHVVEWFKDGVLVPGVFGETLVVDQPAVVAARYVSSDGLDCASLKSIHFTIAAAPNPIPNIASSSTPVLCGLPDTIVLGVAPAPAGFGYQWYYDGEVLPVDTLQSFNAVAPGAYTFQYTGGQCTPVASTPVQVGLVLQPVIDYQQSSGIMSIQGTYDSIQWVMHAGGNEWIPLEGENGPELAPLDGGSWAVQVFVGDCFLQSDPVIITGVPMPVNVRKFSLSPNPTPGHLILDMELKTSERLTVSLFDASGRQMFLQTKQGQVFNMPIDLHVLPAGPYFIKIQTENGLISRTIVKQ